MTAPTAESIANARLDERMKCAAELEGIAGEAAAKAKSRAKKRDEFAWTDALVAIALENAAAKLRRP